MFPVSPAWMKSQLYCTMGVVVFLRNCSRLLLAHLLLLCCIIRQCSHPSAEIVCMTWAVLSNPLGQSQTHGDLVQHTPAQKGVKCDFWLKKKKKKSALLILFFYYFVYIYIVCKARHWSMRWNCITQQPNDPNRHLGRDSKLGFQRTAPWGLFLRCTPASDGLLLCLGASLLVLCNFIYLLITWGAQLPAPWEDFIKKSQKFFENET